MSLAGDLMAALRAGMAKTAEARAGAAVARSQADEMIAEIQRATDGSSDEKPAEAIVRWQQAQVRLDEAAELLNEGDAALEGYISEGLGGSTRAVPATPVRPWVPTRVQVSTTSTTNSPTTHPVFRQRARFGASTSNDYRKTFFDKHPHTEGEVVVHHAVEQQAQRRYPGLISDSQLHSYENLRGVPKGDINRRVHLSAIRKSWNRFYKRHPNPTEQQLLDHATEIDDTYGTQFNPPVR